MMDVILIKDVKKKFKVYYDKGRSFKEKILFRNRNRYEDRWVLQNVNLSVAKGEALGLIGENGCGKSTLLKLITQILYPDSGEIVTKGRISSLIELGAGFHMDMSGRENIYTNAAIFGLTRKEIDKRLNDIIAFSELEEFIDNPVRTYSSGMYMRLAFSVAINVDADILLIDEILAVGDANFQLKCFNKLREIKTKGVTIVLVTHDTGTVSSFCDKAAWLDSGRIVEYGDSKVVTEAYLNSMREKRYCKLNQEALTVNQTDVCQADGVEVSAISEAIEASEASESTGSALVENIPSKDIKITSAVIRNCRGKPTLVLHNKESFTIEINYESNKNTDEFCVGIAIWTMGNTMVYGINSQLAGKTISIKRGSGTVRICIDSMLLTEGQYSVHVAMESTTGGDRIYLRDYCIVNVISDSKCAGVIDFPYSFEVVQE